MFMYYILVDYIALQFLYLGLLAYIVLLSFHYSPHCYIAYKQVLYLYQRLTSVKLTAYTKCRA